MREYILKVNKLNIIVLFIFLNYGCSVETTSSEEEPKQVEASKQESPLQIVLKSLQEYTFPMEISYDSLPEKCIPVSNELFITHNIKIQDPSSFTVDEIDSQDLFQTAEIFFCNSFDISNKFQGILAKVEDKATAISNSVYLFVFDKRKFKPISGIALSYVMQTPQNKRILTGKLTKKFTLKIFEKKIDVETNSEEVFTTSIKIDTLQGTFIKL